MRHTLPDDVAAPGTPRNDWQTLKTLFPYLWQYKSRVVLALSCLILAKVATVVIPLLLKYIVDGLAGGRRRWWRCRWG